jgi:GntR family transcriptional regulator, transcriptional repressor for pyruvate dehydrogenase complex
VQHRAIYDAVIAGDPEAARAASIRHIDFVERAMAEADRSDEWRRISRLRLSQRREERRKRATDAG